MKLLIFLGLIGLALTQNSEYCGLGTESPNKILGGTASKNGDWGWQISLKFNGRHICGGSLINEQWIVTAAHCLYGATNPSKYTIDAGITSRKTPNNWSKLDLKVSKIVMHSKYDDDEIINDIALMKLSNPVTFETSKNRIVPVCIPSESDSFQGQIGYATGWGATKVSGSSSNDLMEVALLLQTNSACKSYFKALGVKIDVSTQVCAGVEGDNKDTCQGDSGGPLVARDSNGRWNLFGITSFGFGCGDIGAYTRVSAYADWISNKIAGK